MYIYVRHVIVLIVFLIVLLIELYCIVMVTMVTAAYYSTANTHCTCSHAVYTVQDELTYVIINECTAFTCLPVGVTETLGLVDEYNEEGVVSVGKNVGVAIIDDMVFTTEVSSDKDSDEKMGVVSVAFIEGEAVSITEIPIDDTIINEDAADDVGGACDNEDKVGVSRRVGVV